MSQEVAILGYSGNTVGRSLATSLVSAADVAKNETCTTVQERRTR